ncbi:alcohol dehydrogenase catalytic domain-containing protein [Acidisoma sp. 7E03]
MPQDSETYQAVAAVAPGQLVLMRKPVTAPPPGHVRLRIEACGVCHSDAATVEGVMPIAWPRVPGHEAVGVIDAIGEGVAGWSLGQRAGVGFLGGACGYCRACRGGDLVHCENQGFTGVHADGGYAEVMIAKASGLVSVPDDMASVEAAPLLCAGLTTFSALRNAGAKAGDLVAILGIGGLGHLAVQYARHMGFEVVALARGGDKEALARKLGAHHYLDTEAEDAVAALQRLGGASLLVATAAAGTAVATLLRGLTPGGKVITLGATQEPLPLSVNDLLFAGRSIEGALTGDPATGDTTLRFSQLSGVAPMIETMPLEEAPAAYARMMSGKARFRVVLTMTPAAR